jgi:hypothetical protein
MNTQTEALLNRFYEGEEAKTIITEAAAELRRLHSLNQELVEALKYIEAQTHLGHIHDTASSALTKARGTE